MSKLALNPNASGTGTYTLASPANNASHTITLPVATGTLLTDTGVIPAAQLTGVLPSINGSNLTNVSAPNLTGALPAIDGASLTSLTSSALTGALPAIDGSALTGVGGSSTTFNAVGTYVLGYLVATGVNSGGATFAGSGIRTANTYAAGGGTSGASSSVLSGTWRLMGNTGYFNSGSTASNTNVSGSVFVRIS